MMADMVNDTTCNAISSTIHGFIGVLMGLK